MAAKDLPARGRKHFLCSKRYNPLSMRNQEIAIAPKMTNYEIAVAIGYTHATGGHWIKPNGELYGYSEPQFRMNDAAALEIDDWLHGQGFGTELWRHAAQGQFHYCIMRARIGDAPERFEANGPTRSTAIVAGFEQFKEGEKSK